ncbi:MAG: hypothetical protein EOO29_03420 [Comamonadaceae bacterium]|nr:MAG: hypothetical protein EOO29_03420 [Comamonadaceae bacterium]
MNMSKLTALALAATLGLASVSANAQSHGRDGRDRDHRPGVSARHDGWQGQRPQARHGMHDRYDRDDRRHRPLMTRGVGPQHQFHRGQRLPAEWRGQQYRVNDWRARHLSPPPRGQQWVQVGADFALVAIATGVITSLIMNQ